MNYPKNSIINQFEGYFNAFQLWHGSLNGLNQFELPSIDTPQINILLDDKLRLGKRVERFFSFELSLDDAVKVLLENYQVQDDKITLGELDVIIEKDGQPIHIEVVYKFYLLDTTMGTNEIEHCIGPNKRDSLVQKLTKLKEKQLPLLYHEKTQLALQSYTIDRSAIKQYVFFKAELFLPYNTSPFSFSILNENCVNGYYLGASDLIHFSLCKFYIPNKINWIQIPDVKADWITYLNFKTNIEKALENKISPLFWVKFPNGKLQKMFVVWWL